MTKKNADDQFRVDMMDFKDQMLKFVDVANQKFDGLTADVRTNSFKLDRLENGLGRMSEKLDSVASDLKNVSGQFTDVAGMVIRDHHPRIEKLEERVDALESETH